MYYTYVQYCTYVNVCTRYLRLDYCKFNKGAAQLIEHWVRGRLKLAGIVE
jgi:hypothetical protein